VVIGVVAAVFFRIALQPHLTTTAALIATLVPFFIVGGLAKAGKYSAIAGTDFNMCFLLGSQAGMPAVAAAVVLNDSAALVLAAGLMTLAYVFMPRRFHVYAEEAAGFIREDLRRLISGKAPEKPEEWHGRTSRQILRLMLHLGRAGELGRSAPPSLLAALNLGHAVAAIRTVAALSDLPPVARKAAEDTLRALQRFEDDPLGVANAIVPLAGTAQVPAVTQAILDAADALRGLEPLVTFGRPRP
jgi:uncharacterized membrane protein YccC